MGNKYYGMVSLFSKAPSFPKGVNTHLRETYGVVEGSYGKKVLNSTINGARENSHRGGHNFMAVVNEALERIYIQIRDTKTQKIIDDEIYWSFSVLSKALEKNYLKLLFYMGTKKMTTGSIMLDILK